MATYNKITPMWLAYEATRSFVDAMEGHPYQIVDGDEGMTHLVVNVKPTNVFMTAQARAIAAGRALAVKSISSGYNRFSVPPLPMQTDIKCGRVTPGVIAGGMRFIEQFKLPQDRAWRFDLLASHR